ncbi:oligosaccharide flippase family protein [Moraxella osloensis]|uniref:oligosaccharide flippase family protein n=1 Tax=Faucicola osloensis TaxID=34062 RepID=UPI0034E01004
MSINLFKVKIIQNILALGIVQIVNYILPLLLIPFLIKTIGINAWGQISFIQFFMQYFVVFVSFGFQWSAVRRLSIERNNIRKLKELFKAYFCAQVLLLIISFLILILLVNTFSKFQELNLLVFNGFLVVVGSVIFPYWMMQALEELKVMSATQVISQLLCFSMIFLCVKSVEDIQLAMFFQSINNIIAGILCIIYLNRKGFKLGISPLIEIKQVFRDSLIIFKSQIWISVYTNTIPVVLGFVGNSDQVATYTLADKIQKAIRFLLNPISNAVFPRMSYLFKVNDGNVKKMFIYSLYFTLTVTAIGGLLIFSYADEFVDILGGTSLTLAPKIVQIFSLMPILVGFSNILSVQWLLPLGREKELQRIWFLTAFYSLFITFPVCYFYGVIGAGYLAVVIELFVVLMMIKLMRKNYA